MKLKVTGIIILLFCLVFTFAACTGNSPGQNGEEALEDRITDGGRLPLEDAELAEHKPRHIILKGEINQKVKQFLQQEGAEITDDLLELELNVYRIRFPEGTVITETVKQLRKFSSLQTAEPDYRVNKFPVEKENNLVQEQSSNLTGTEDKYAENLWNMAAVNAEEAWDIATGEDVVIALIDTGVQADHPDLTGRVLDGFNVFENNSATEDFYNHGTHVAGTAAAKAGGGVVGVAKEAEILPVKVFHEEGHPTYTFEIARGISWLTDWVRENDEQVVVNMSLGGFYYSNIVQNAIDEARKEGIVFVAAMGNSAMVDSQYPARYEGVISAGAIDGRYNPADFTSRGDWMSVTAPGVEVLSSEIEGDYGLKSGTSMSAPHVSGVAALLLSKNPDLSPGEVKRIIEKTAADNKIDQQEEFDPDYGYGLVDAGAALEFDPDKLETAQSVRIEVEKIDDSGKLVPAYKSRAALYDENSNFLQDTKTDDKGEAVFHDLDTGKYELKVYHSFADKWPRKDFPVEDEAADKIQLGYGYSYLTERKNIELAEDDGQDRELDITLEGGILQGIRAEINGVDVLSWLDNLFLANKEDKNIFNKLDMPAYELRDYSFDDDFTDIDLAGKSEAELETILGYLQDHPGNILLAEGDYSVTGELSPETLGDVSSGDLSSTTEISVTSGENKKAEFSELKLPDETGILGLSFEFTDESGAEIKDRALSMEIKVHHNGEKLETLTYQENTEEFIREKSSIALLSETGDYELFIQGGTVYDPDNPVEYRKVGYKEVTVEINEGEILQEQVKMELN